MKQIVALLLAFSVSVAASERSFEGEKWRIDAYKYDVSLSYISKKTTKIRFYKGAGEKLSLKLSAPFLLPEITGAKLYLVSSPLMKEHQKKLVASHSNMKNNGIVRITELEFIENIDQVIDAMEKGSWALVELSSKGGVGISIRATVH